uniref:Pectinesterase, active site-containing protein n=1 Tax=Tanacetum cinerariifolium TaxID=118510 RepID=A0A699GKF2_TANCI|nr:pectinesterase, active site-containing protein [Tanacetum cinerariifolium]
MQAEAELRGEGMVGRYVYYGEYGNIGRGSNIQGRVKWLGHHVMDENEASNFKVSKFIMGQKWLDSTSFPYHG